MSEGVTPRELGLFAGNGWARRTAGEEVSRIVEKAVVPDDVRNTCLEAGVRQQLDEFPDTQAREDFWQSFLDGARTYLVGSDAAKVVKLKRN
jgi:hypothetical protein